MKTDKRLQNRILEVILWLGLLPLTAGCRQEITMPPVLVSEPVCLLSSAGGNFRYAGVSFEVCNTGTQKIVSMEVSFVVFKDEKGGNPFYGSNVLNAVISLDLAPSSSAPLEVSLDPRLAVIPETPFVIDCFYVTKITWDDGSEWTDPYGLYYAGSIPS